MPAKVVTDFEEELNKLVHEHDKLITLIKGYSIQSPLDQFISEDSPEYELMRRRDANIR